MQPLFPLDAAPYSDDAFQQHMARLGPLGPAPKIACAVSGGSDSLALLLLLDGWCRKRGGEVTALGVDHGLRAEAKDELAYVSQLCLERGIEFTALTWTGDKPVGALQVAAREARYDLMAQHCHQKGVLYLALAHHQDDQGETFLLRLDAGSGVRGLSGMPRWRPQENLCYLRPLLSVPKARLQAYLHRLGVAWQEDPSNQDSRNKRVTWRQAASSLAEVGLSSARLSDLPGLYGRLRGQWEKHIATLLAQSASLRPEGFAWLKPEVLLAAPDVLGQAVLSRLLTCLSGAAYPPRQDAVKRLLSDWRQNEEEKRGVTLGGCCLLPRRGGQVLVIREKARIEEAKFLSGERRLWDGRFVISLAQERSDFEKKNDALSITCLGEDGWRELLAWSPGLRKGPVPAAAAMTLPAIRHLDSLLVVPHLEYRQEQNLFLGMSVRFRPRQVLADPAFT